MKMKMKIVTAKQKFDFAVWSVLDGIEKNRLPYPNRKVIDYMVGINANSLTKSQFYEVKHFLEENLVLKEVDEPDTFENDERGTPNYQCFLIFHFKILDLFDEYYKKYTYLINGGVEIETIFGFDNKIFWLKLVDGSKATINFNPRGNRKQPTQPYYLLKAFIQSIKSGNFEHKGSYIETSLTVEQIISAVRTLNYQNPNDLSSTWVTNARSNLINKSIPKNLQKLMLLNHFDSKSKTYTFSLKIF